MPTHKGEGTSATPSLTGMGKPYANFLGSGAVVFWGFWIRCVKVKLISPALAMYGRSVPNYGYPPIRGRVPGLPMWEDPCANLLGSGKVVFWGFGCPVLYVVG